MVLSFSEKTVSGAPRDFRIDAGEALGAVSASVATTGTVEVGVSLTSVRSLVGSLANWRSSGLEESLLHAESSTAISTTANHRFPAMWWRNDPAAPRELES